ncbi:cytochrome c [Sorangium sp. So ce134]
MSSRGVLLPICLLALAGCKKPAPRPGQVLDEALRAGRTADSFVAADEDYFHAMDGGVDLNRDEVKGRNTWIVWSAGNDRLWDTLATVSKGNLDFLKTLSSHPKLKFSRDSRWNYLGVVNEPCFERATGPDPERFGLWLDRRRADCPPDPFEDESKYPGVAIGARGKTVPVGSYYGYASGIVGLRLFPNPDFDEEAARKWDPVRYYEDPSYYYSRDLVRPYRVGMSCAFCHIGPIPTNPPADPENPRWENLSATVGSQYFWWDRVFTWDADRSSFPYQVFHVSRPGTLDTSFVSTDYITNPRTMNAIYEFGPRLQQGRRWGKERLSGGELLNAQLNDFVKQGPLTRFFEPKNTVWTPRVLKDGSDSVGALGSLNRVYLNIGEFSEEWLLHFNPLIGGKPTTPIPLAVARKNSAYWGATEQQTFATALYFLKSTAPHKLKDAPAGARYMTDDAAKLTRGKEVFAERCARCHSSKLPAKAPGLDPDGCAGPDYLTCFDRYWEWTKTDAFKKEMRAIVLKDDFLEGNYLSSDLRIPVTLLETNACSPLATNALKGSIWEDFSSHSYKELPAVGTITVHHPVTGEPRPFKMPGGGRGYTRVPSLISLWSTAPFLLNNTVGKFDPSPSVEARMASFQDAIEKMLWPERREKDKVLGDKVPGVIDRTNARSYLRVPAGYLPEQLRPLLSPLERVAPWLVGEGGIEIGPIPKDTPVNLLANLALTSESAAPAERLAHGKKLLAVLLKLKRDLKALPENASDEEARRVFMDVTDPLLELSQCPDFVVNRGHYFGTSYFTQEPGLSDEDKRALIEFLKTF